MKFIKKQPARHLAHLVRHYWYLDITEADIPFSQTSFTYGSFDLICYLENPNSMQWLSSGKPFTEPEIFYSGQITKPFLMSFDKPCRCIGAGLYPWAGNVLFNIPSDEFTNELVPLDLLEKDMGLYDQLMRQQDIEGLFTSMENYIAQRLPAGDPDPIAKHIALGIIQNPVQHQVDLLVHEVGLSRRRIEQRFLQATGVPISLFIRKARFQKAVSLIGMGATRLTGIGLTLGYYDQAHFIHDFRAFSGHTPGSFTRNQTELNVHLKTLVQQK